VVLNLLFGFFIALPIAIKGEMLIADVVNAVSLPWIASAMLIAVLPETLIACFLLGSDS
jgi:hypothetical protein